MIFTRIGAEDLTEEEIKGIRKITDLTIFGYEPKHVMQDELLRVKQFWRWPNGLMITKVNTHPEGKELEVWGLVGRGVFVEGFKTECWNLARFLECRWISAGCLGRGQARLYASRLGIEPKGTYFIEEV